MLWFCYGSTASILCSNPPAEHCLDERCLAQRLHLSAELIPSAEGNEGLLSIQPSDYPALSQSGGSIRLGFNPIRSNHQPDGTLQPLLINRLEDGTLKAMSYECPHGSCAVYLQHGQSVSCLPLSCFTVSTGWFAHQWPRPLGLETYLSEEQPDGSLHVLVPRLRFTLSTQVVSKPEPAPALDLRGTAQGVP